VIPTKAKPGVGAWLDTGTTVFQPRAASPTDRRGLGLAKLGHPIQDTARKARLDVPTPSTPGAKAIVNDGLVAEEGILHTGLPVEARGFLPLAPPERFHVGNRATRAFERGPRRDTFAVLVGGTTGISDVTYPNARILHPQDPYSDPQASIAVHGRPALQRGTR